MRKQKIALVGVGGISQIVRIPTLKKNDDVELVALCDIDEAKVSFIADKYDVPHVYFDIQNLLKNEEIDGIFICTPNNLHYPMALASLEEGIATLVEKPVALNAIQAKKLEDKAAEKKATFVIGMNNRFREDAVILKEFLQKNELGNAFYVKTGWLKRWNRHPQLNWLSDVKISGGGVLMDLGIQLIDLALWLVDKPKVKNVRAYCYNIFTKSKAEDSALVVLETINNIAITVEVSWRLHLENDLIYTHVFGTEGGALLNPLRLNKEMHGNLVNVTPMQSNTNIDMFKKAFENEIQNFIDVIMGKAQPATPAADGVYIMKIIDAIYKSSKDGCQIELEN